MRFFNRLADGQIADQLVILRHAEHIRHLAADVVRVGDVPFDPAAFVTHRNRGDEDVLNRGGIILNEERAVAVSDDAAREHEDHRGRGLADAGVGEGVELR